MKTRKKNLVHFFSFNLYLVFFVINCTQTRTKSREIERSRTCTRKIVNLHKLVSKSGSLRPEPKIQSEGGIDRFQDVDTQD